MILYEIIMMIGLVLYLPVFFWHAKHRDHCSERFGLLDPDTREFFKTKRVLWVHGVSAGEVDAALRLIDELSASKPDLFFLLSTSTQSGRAIALSRCSKATRVVYKPFDSYIFTRLMLSGIHVEALVLMETEIWPSIINYFYKRNLPVFIVNGRISDRAWATYQKFTFYFRNVMSKVSVVCAQDSQMCERFVAMGTPEDKVQVQGNIKFDWEPDHDLVKVLSESVLISQWGKNKIWIAASTHEGEEAIILAAYLSLRKSHSNLRLCLAPRHLERLPQVRLLLERQGLKIISVLRGKWNDYSMAAPSSDDVYLVEQMGVLASLYAYADIVFVGGSLVPVGGHNMAEAAYFAKPVLHGPYVQNFRVLGSVLASAGASKTVSSTEDLVEAVHNLLSDSIAASQMGGFGQAALEAHRGAICKQARVILGGIA